MADNTEITIPVTLSNQADYDRAESDLLSYIREMALVDKELNERLADTSIEELLAECRALRAKHPRALGQMPENSDASALREYLHQAIGHDRAYRSARAKALARLTVLRRLVGLGKVEAVIEWLSDFFEENPDEKMVVFAHHRHVQERLIAAFPNCARILGGQSLPDSDQSKHRFQRDPNCTLIVVSEEAGGEGINLSSGYYSMIVEWPWTAKAINQMLGRSYGRMDNPHTIAAHFCHAAGSIDDEIRKILHYKLQMSSMILDGKEADGFLAQPIGDELLASLLTQSHQTIP